MKQQVYKGAAVTESATKVVKAVFDRRFCTDEEWKLCILKPVRTLRQWLGGCDGGLLEKKVHDFNVFVEVAGAGGFRDVNSIYSA